MTNEQKAKTLKLRRIYEQSDKSVDVVTAIIEIAHREGVNENLLTIPSNQLAEILDSQY